MVQVEALVSADKQLTNHIANFKVLFGLSYHLCEEIPWFAAEFLFFQELKHLTFPQRFSG